MMETLTNELCEEALKIIKEIEELGGMTKAIGTGEVNNFDVLKIDNTEVRRKQIERIQATRASRDEKAC